MSVLYVYLVVYGCFHIGQSFTKWSVVPQPWHAYCSLDLFAWTRESSMLWFDWGWHLKPLLLETYAVVTWFSLFSLSITKKSFFILSNWKCSRYCLESTFNSTVLLCHSLAFFNWEYLNTRSPKWNINSVMLSSSCLGLLIRARDAWGALTTCKNWKWTFLFQLGPW